MTNYFLKETMEFLKANKDRIDEIRMLFQLKLAYIGDIFNVGGCIFLIADNENFMVDVQQISWEAYDRICSLSTTKS